MSTFTLVERLDDITPIPSPTPSYMTVMPKDSDSLDPDPDLQEVLTNTLIRSREDYINLIDPSIYLHSALKNPFFLNLTEVLKEEYQNFIDYTTVLKDINDIDFYDGDQTRFLSKISVLLELFDYNAPLTFMDYTNIEAGDALDVTKQNDFLRNIIKRIWLQRRWAGSSWGYKLPFKFINRLGAIHLSIKYPTTNTITSNTNKIYRLLDLDNLYPATQESPTFPDSVHIKESTSFSKAQIQYLHWDTGRNWDEGVIINTVPNPDEAENTPNIINWDTPLPFDSGSKGLLLEVSADRLLLNTANTGVTESLMQNELLNAVSTILPYIKRAQDFVNIGTQLTLTTSNNGYVNYLSQDRDGYTHPNIHAKFQTFLHLPDRVSTSWVSADAVTFIKIGTGNLDINTPVFIDYMIAEDPDDPTKTVPTDLQYPVFESSIGVNERALYKNYELINIVMHNRSIHGEDLSDTIIINGTGVSNDAVRTTYIPFVHNYITPGSLHLNIDIEKTIPEIVVDELTTGIDFSDVEELNSYSYEITVEGKGTQINLPGNININNNLILIDSPTPTVDALSSGIDFYDYDADPGINKYIDDTNASSGVYVITISGVGIANNMPSSINIFGTLVYITSADNATTDTIATKIANTTINNWTVTRNGSELTFTNDPSIERIVSILEHTVIPNWTITRTGNTLTFNSSLMEIHQRINMYQQFNPINSVYDTRYKFQNLNETSGVYEEIADKYVLYGYSQDYSYGGAEDYLPVIQKQIVNLLPLYEINKYPTLESSLHTYYNMDNFHLGDLSLFDNSGNGRLGVVTGCDVDDGISLQGIDLNGSSDTISLGTASFIETDEFTINAYVNFIARSAVDRTIYSRELGALKGIRFYMTGNTPSIEISDDGTNLITLSCDSGITEDSMITITFKHSEYIRIYINGVLEKELIIGVPVLAYYSATQESTLGSNGASEYFLGVIDEFRLYTRALSDYEISILGTKASDFADLILDSYGQYCSVWFDAINSRIIMKLQYNPNGIMRNDPEITTLYSSVNVKTEKSYTLNNTNTEVSITEMGLFDAHNNMVAYATFPPIIYDPTNYHLAFNLLIQTTN